MGVYSKSVVTDEAPHCPFFGEGYDIVFLNKAHFIVGDFLNVLNVLYHIPL